MASPITFPPTSKYQIKTAGKIWTSILNRLGFVGLTLPTRTIYIHPTHVGKQWLINHELAHIAQIDRDGPWHFWPKIIIDYFRYGHQNSPLEIEARKYETHG